jgi:hypothetical protein
MKEVKRIMFKDAVAERGIPEKVLAGRCARNDMGDPHVVDRNEEGEYVLIDDWSLANLEKACATP